MKKGVIYARYSSHAQREESIEQQVEECAAFAKANDIQICEVYSDKAVSGKTDKRASFQRLMRDAEKKRFEVVVAYKSNRIARNMFNALSYENKLASFGIETLYAKEEFGNTAAGRFALRTMMNVNQFYSENMSEDIKRGLRDNAEKALSNGNLPYGYTTGEDRKYVIDPTEAAVVREVFERYVHGEQFAHIAQDLNERGYRTKRGNPWNKGSFHRMLGNTTYIGTYHHSGVTLENAVPPIVSKELFNAAQAKLKESRPYAKNYDYCLTGKLFCGECGQPMIGCAGKTVDGVAQYHYYTCKSRRAHACDKAHEDKARLEQEVASLTRDIVLQDEFIEWIAEQAELAQKMNSHGQELARIEALKREKEKAVKNILAAIEQGIFTASVQERLVELESEVSDLSERVRELRTFETPVEKDRIIFALRKFRDENVSNHNFCRVLVRTFVEKIIVWDDKIEIDFFFTKDGSTVHADRGQSYTVVWSPPFSPCTTFVIEVWFPQGFNIIATRSH